MEKIVLTDLYFNEKLAELLSIDLNIEIYIELVKNTEKDVILGRKSLQSMKLTDMPRTAAKQK